MTSLFTHIDNIEGHVGVGQLPTNLHPIINDVENTYYNLIPDKNISSYHIWCDNLPLSIKSKIEILQKSNFWNKLCIDNSYKCINVNGMDELYYSNYKITSDNITLSQNLYGNTANVSQHKDCHNICSLDNIILYRVLIGVTNNNNNIITKLTNLNIEKKINKYDYIVFDFSRTTHQVIKENKNIDTPRIILKLHFIVYKEYKYSKFYINFIKKRVH